MKKWLILVTFVVLVASLFVQAIPVSACVYGNSPGFWKHPDIKPWPAEYAANPTFESVFERTPAGLTSSATLLDVLKKGGGGKIAFDRQAVAQLLNIYAADPPLDPSMEDFHFNWLKDAVQAVLDDISGGIISHPQGEYSFDLDGWIAFIEGYNI